jgi:L,D-peptidoglycan transpeptidase YkuD (ErfK/YbiS/YcfS/YnhG family)
MHHVVGMLYRPDRILPPTAWARPILPRDLWSDDVTDPDYNLMVRAPHPFSHECLRRADPMYDLVMVLDWNWPVAEAGRGSAIFIHAWRGKGRPTAGCIAFRSDHLAWIAARISLGSRVVIV